MKIEIQDLHFSYPGDITAINGITLAIEPGERVAIVGQNGAGKTTLVKHFNGLLRPTQGNILIDGWNTKDYSVAKLAAKVGYVFQNPDEQLFKKTVYEEIIFGPKNLQYSPDRIEELAQDAIDMADLQAYRDHNPYDLSPTWRKMVALASIIAMDTPIVIFDEPTTGQDIVNINRIASIVNTLHERGKTMITISHDIDFCAENFHRLIALAHGKVLLDGPISQVVSQEEILATTYVDPPQLTRLGKQLGFPQPIYNQEGFLEAYRQTRSM